MTNSVDSPKICQEKRGCYWTAEAFTMLNRWLFCVCLFTLATSFNASANVVLIGRNISLSFSDIEANFASSMKGYGIRGTLYLADPLDACSPLSNGNISNMDIPIYPFVLIIRGRCSFEDKVRNAQVAGFKAAIVYNNENDDLVSMAGSSAGVKITAVFVSRTCGETLARYAISPDMELWIVPTFDNSAFSIMAISFISLLSISAVLATCFFVRRHRIRREQPRDSNVREFHGMSRQLVRAMPSLRFTAVVEDNTTSRACAICLEDYAIGEKLRILPCLHKFHAVCVDSWLTSWRTFCPVCKHDARSRPGEPAASESTPLLCSSAASLASATPPSSVASSAIVRAPHHSRSVSIAGASYSRHSRHSLHSQHPSASDFRNMSSQRLNAAYLASPQSFGYPSSSPLNSRSRYLSPYVPGYGNAASSSYVGSSSYVPNPLQYSESARTFSSFASVQSLPEC